MSTVLSRGFRTSYTVHRVNGDVVECGESLARAMAAVGTAPATVVPSPNRSLIAWVNSHDVGANPTVREDRGTTLLVACWESVPDGAGGFTAGGEVLEEIPATIEAARDWLGY